MNEIAPPPATAFPHLELRGLYEIAQHPERIDWQPFVEGVMIHRLYGDGITGPTAALIRFLQDAEVPAHYHQGYEHIFVLAGKQRDANGEIAAGTLRIHPPGTRHTVSGDAGCIVLAIYEKPVKFSA